MRSVTLSSFVVSLELISYLDYDTVVQINREFGGPGAVVRDADGIQGAIHQPSQAWDGSEHYPTIWHKAAVLLRGLAATQYFGDGNKRTGYLCAETFLEVNGIKLRTVKPIYAEVFVRGVAARAVSVDKAAEWLWTTETTLSRIRRHLIGTVEDWVTVPELDQP